MVARVTPIRPRLTDRQMEVVHLLAEGLSIAQIGRRLGLSPWSVRAHETAIVERLDVLDGSHKGTRAVKVLVRCFALGLLSGDDLIAADRAARGEDESC